jgi:hypothetical protein
MGTKKSWSLLNSDQTPASFWITHPDNNLEGNHAAGSDYYGFWYNLVLTTMGPSAYQGGCPENHKLGKFVNNTGHSNGEHGLNIYNKFIPRRWECENIEYDEANPNPFWKNPLQPAIFRDFIGFKNIDSGASAFHVGDVRFQNFKTADNGRAGIVFEMIHDAIFDNRAMVINSMVIGKTSNGGCFMEDKSPAGVIVPRTEWFTV